MFPHFYYIKKNKIKPTPHSRFEKLFREESYRDAEGTYLPLVEISHVGYMMDIS